VNVPSDVASLKVVHLVCSFLENPHRHTAQLCDRSAAAPGPASRLDFRAEQLMRHARRLTVFRKNDGAEDSELHHLGSREDNNGMFSLVYYECIVGWHPEQGVEEEENFQVTHVERAVGLIHWFLNGAAR
jgi:hypothetical protein